MSKRDNFAQAANELFGIGGKSAAHAADTSSVKQEAPAASAPAQQQAAPAPKPAPKPAYVPTPRSGNDVTVLAAGTVFEGNLRAKGDVELSGSFKGEIISDGDIRMYSSMEGNVSGRNVELSTTCGVQGDIQATAMLRVGQEAVVSGNVHAHDVVCSGRIVGNIQAEGSVKLSGSASITGDLTAAAFSSEEGASIDGRLKIVKNKA